MKKHCFYVYILANFKRNVLYIGITRNLVIRIWEHKNDLVGGFTSKYKVHDLLYYESFDDPESAIAREKQLKRWNRKKKDTLINKFNPELVDLYSSII